MVVGHDTSGAILFCIDGLVWFIECDASLICSMEFEDRLEREERTRLRLSLSLDEDAGFKDCKPPTLEKERFLSLPNSGAGSSGGVSSAPCNARYSPLLPDAKESSDTGTEGSWIVSKTPSMDASRAPANGMSNEGLQSHPPFFCMTLNKTNSSLLLWCRSTMIICYSLSPCAAGAEASSLVSNTTKKCCFPPPDTQGAIATCLGNKAWSRPKAFPTSRTVYASTVVLEYFRS